MESEHRYKTLYDLARKLSSSLATDEVLNTIVESITNAFAAKGCSLMLLTPDKKQLRHTISYGLSKTYLKKGLVKSSPIIDEVLKGKPVAVLDASEDPRVQYKEEARKEGIASMLSIPLRPDEEVVGIIRVYTSEPRHFSNEDIELIGSLANLGTIALGKARRHQELDRDLKLRSAQVAKLEEDKARFLQFLSVAAHDLKAPLTAIQSYLWVILRGLAGEISDKQRNMLQRSSQRIDELLTLISDLLDIPRIESGQVVQQMDKVSLRKIVNDCYSELREHARQKGLDLKVELPRSLCKIHGSAPHLRQVMTNLLSNAINYTNEGEIKVRMSDKKDAIQVEVIDTGVGILPEELPHIFEDFFRGSNVQVKGTGLGLSIVKRIVEAHDGEIYAESPCAETNAGSRFTLTLPKKNDTKWNKTEAKK